MGDIAIEVKNLNIYYPLYKEFSIRKNLFSGKWRRRDTFHALKDISFQLEQGEILGVVGLNGSGKSTLLRALAGIFGGDSGTIDLKGHSISLLSLGIGFRVEMTGRENIFLSGLLMHFTKEEIQDRLQSIIEFSELGEFIDLPVRMYSSGMYSKLAFSIAINLDTDIILIDEVLSVGDEGFAQKSYQRIQEIINDKNKTVVIVSHNSRTLEELCDKALWLERGEVVQMGDAKEVLPDYRSFTAMRSCSCVSVPQPPEGTGTVSSLLVPADINRGIFEDCSENADGTLDPSWYPGEVVRNLNTSRVTYIWDRYESTLEILDRYGAIYRKNSRGTNAYLTFDCGNEMGYTEKILDILKEKDVKAIFFCPGNFFDYPGSAGLIARMVEEGHLIGNHTMHHPVMVYESDEDFMDELNELEQKLNEILGYHYPLTYYRPPEGATNERDLYLARQMGYTTVLWSFAYYDYDAEAQWPVDEALLNAETGLHNGCVYLLHVKSETNVKMLGDLIDYIRGEGYKILRIDQP